MLEPSAHRCVEMVETYRRVILQRLGEPIVKSLIGCFENARRFIVHERQAKVFVENRKAIADLAENFGQVRCGHREFAL